MRLWAQHTWAQRASPACTNYDRGAQLRRVIETLEPGDVLMVTRLDRLARSTRDLLNTLAVITEQKAGFRPWATHGPTRRHRTAG
jgi:hypothetical protein